jgi:hypothetical protein
MVGTHCGPSVIKVSGLRDFRVSGLRTSGVPTLVSSKSSDIRNSDLLYPLWAHVTQLFPTTTVACGMLRRVHVTFDDVIGSYHVHFSFREFGFREFVRQHISLFPIAEIAKLRFTFRLIQRSSFLPLIYGVDHFGTLEFRASGVRASTHLSFPDSQNRDLLLRLILRSSSFLAIYGVDLFGTSEFRASGVRASTHLTFPDSRIPERFPG